MAACWPRATTPGWLPGGGLARRRPAALAAGQPPRFPSALPRPDPGRDRARRLFGRRSRRRRSRHLPHWWTRGQRSCTPAASPSPDIVHAVSASRRWRSRRFPWPPAGAREGAGRRPHGPTLATRLACRNVPPSPRGLRAGAARNLTLRAARPTPRHDWRGRARRRGTVAARGPRTGKRCAGARTDKPQAEATRARHADARLARDNRPRHYPHLDTLPRGANCRLDCKALRPRIQRERMP